MMAVPPDPVRQLVPASSGCYVLVLKLITTVGLAVGRREPVDFPPGYYLYVGSAFGHGGLRARLGRHITASGRQHWHVDYLRAVAEPVEAWFQTQAVSREHDWANCLSQGRGMAPVAGFGASDCHCGTHLYRARTLPRWQAFRARLPQQPGTVVPLRRLRVSAQP